MLAERERDLRKKSKCRPVVKVSESALVNTVFIIYILLSDLLFFSSVLFSSLLFGSFHNPG